MIDKAIEPMRRDAQRLAANPKSHENVNDWIESNKKVVSLAHLSKGILFNFESFIKLARRFDCATETSHLVRDKQQL